MKKALAVVAVLAVIAFSDSPAEAADLYRATLAPGADGGTGAKLEATWLPGNQFMLSCSSTARYRLCPVADAGSCAAGANDAPVQGEKQVDLCAPAGYTALAVRAADGGSTSCDVFSVTPKTVCQTP